MIYTRCSLSLYCEFNEPKNQENLVNNVRNLVKMHIHTMKTLNTQTVWCISNAKITICKHIHKRVSSLEKLRDDFIDNTRKHKYWIFSLSYTMKIPSVIHIIFLHSF